MIMLPKLRLVPLLIVACCYWSILLSTTTAEAFFVGGVDSKNKASATIITTRRPASALYLAGAARGGGDTKSTTTEKDERRPWEVFRFLSQSSKFVSVPFLQKKKSSSTMTVKPGDVLWKPSSDNNNNNDVFFQFAPLDDVVMGGASSSSFDNKTGKWTGEVTDANNGGFVGIRNTSPNFKWDFLSNNCKGIELTLRSNNSDKPGRYKIGLRDSTEFNGIVWNSIFNVKANGKPTKVRVPLNQLKPTKFARVVNDDTTKGGIQRDNIVGIQLVYSKFEYDGALNPTFQVGNINVQVQEIKAY